MLDVLLLFVANGYHGWVIWVGKMGGTSEERGGKKLFKGNITSTNILG